MLAKGMFELRGRLENEGIIFCYSGYVTEEILTGIGNSIRKKLELDNTDRNIGRRLFSIFVEQMQNVIRYSAEGLNTDDDQKDELRFGLLLVGADNDDFYVSCANKIRKHDVVRLTEQLEHIKGLDREDLMKLYKMTLKGETPVGSKGAGVGFIDIARQAKRGFDFDFMDLDDTHSFFCLKAHV